MAYDPEAARRESCYWKAHAIITRSIDDAGLSRSDILPPVMNAALGNMEQAISAALIDAGADYLEEMQKHRADTNG